MTKPLFTHIIHDARDLAETLADVLREAQADNGDLSTVYFDNPVRLTLIRERLSDGSHVLNLTVSR
jgi:hypothetical protein